MMDNDYIYSVNHFTSLVDAARDALSESLYADENLPGLSPSLELGDLMNMLEHARSCLSEGESKKAFQTILSGAVNLHHPRFMSQQLSAPAPVSVVVDMIVSAMNQGHAVFDMSPLNSLIEDDVLDWVRKKLRLSENAFGVVTGGGSLSNLTALLAARNYLTDWGVWEKGSSNINVEVVTSKLSHYSISKAAGILGIGENNVRTVNTDTLGRLDVKDFESVLSGIHERGSLPVVCLTIANTSTGSTDPIVPCLWLTRNMFEKSWIHVDAAHGGYLSMMQENSIYFDSIDNCDSVTWNAHKMLFQSIPLSFLFFTNRDSADFTSNHDSPYLTQRVKGNVIDKANWTLECSRRSSALKLWCTLYLYGEGYFISSYKKIESVTKYAYKKLIDMGNYQVIGPPESNIVAFRYISESMGKGNYINESIVTNVNDKANFLIGFTRMDGYYYIRLTFMNPKTNTDDVDELVALIYELVSVYEGSYKETDIV